jgi:serine protease Do
VVPDAPAAKAGIEPGDVIVSVDGQSVSGPRQLTRRIGAIEPGATAKIDVMRDGKPVTLSLELTKLENQTAVAAPEAAEPQATEPSTVPAMGISIIPNEGGEGLVVTSVDADGVASDQGIQVGDVISEVNGVMVKSASELSAAIEEARNANRNNVLMRITRDDNASFIALPIARG